MPTGSVTFRTYVIFDNRCPAPRQKDATMNPKPVFYFCNLTGVINYGPLPSVGAQLIDCMDDAGIRCCRLTVEAMTELLRRRPDPAKAQAEIARQTQNAVAWERTALKARAYRAKAQTDLERERANNAVDLDMVRLEYANLRAQLDRADQTAAAWEAHAKTFDGAFRGIDGALDKLGAPSADTLAGRGAGRGCEAARPRLSPRRSCPYRREGRSPRHPHPPARRDRRADF